jgi:hypothetical protein
MFLVGTAEPECATVQSSFVIFTATIIFWSISKELRWTSTIKQG